MFTSLVLVSVNFFTNGRPDKNGASPVILSVIAGKAPNRTVLAGTLAETAGFEIGKSYIAQVRETEASAQYGRQFNWTKVSECSGLDLVRASKELGDAVIFDAAEVPVTSGAENNAA